MTAWDSPDGSWEGCVAVSEICFLDFRRFALGSRASRESRSPLARRETGPTCLRLHRRRYSQERIAPNVVRLAPTPTTNERPRVVVTYLSVSVARLM